MPRPPPCGLYSTTYDMVPLGMARTPKPARSESKATNERSHGARESTDRLVILRTGILHRVATVSPPKRKRWQITERGINAEADFSRLLEERERSRSRQKHGTVTMALKRLSVRFRLAPPVISMC